MPVTLQYATSLSLFVPLLDSHSTLFCCGVYQYASGGSGDSAMFCCLAYSENTGQGRLGSISSTMLGRQLKMTLSWWSRKLCRLQVLSAEILVGRVMVGSGRWVK